MSVVSLINRFCIITSDDHFARYHIFFIASFKRIFQGRYRILQIQDLYAKKSYLIILRHYRFNILFRILFETWWVLLLSEQNILKALSNLGKMMHECVYVTR